MKRYCKAKEGEEKLVCMEATVTVEDLKKVLRRGSYIKDAAIMGYLEIMASQYREVQYIFQ